MTRLPTAMAGRGLLASIFRVSTAPSRLLLRELGKRFDSIAEVERLAVLIVAELQDAQRDALAALLDTLAQAEREIQQEPRTEELNETQREQLAARLLQLSEQQILAALANVYKAARVMQPGQPALTGQRNRRRVHRG